MVRRNNKLIEKSTLRNKLTRQANGTTTQKKIIYYKCPISNPGDHHYYLIKKGERTSLITFSLGL